MGRRTPRPETAEPRDAGLNDEVLETAADARPGARVRGIKTEMTDWARKAGPASHQPVNRTVTVSATHGGRASVCQPGSGGNKLRVLLARGRASGGGHESELVEVVTAGTGSDPSSTTGFGSCSTPAASPGRHDHAHPESGSRLLLKCIKPDCPSVEWSTPRPPGVLVPQPRYRHDRRRQSPIGRHLEDC